MAAAQERHEQVEGCTYASLAALAVYLHNRAALASLDGYKGPVPPSRVAAYLPQAIAGLLDEKAVLDDKNLNETHSMVGRDMMSRPTAVLDYTDLGIVGHEN